MRGVRAEKNGVTYWCHDSSTVKQTRGLVYNHLGLKTRITGFQSQAPHRFARCMKMCNHPWRQEFRHGCHYFAEEND